jgi:hypothetical protein
MEKKSSNGINLFTVENLRTNEHLHTEKDILEEDIKKMRKFISDKEKTRGEKYHAYNKSNTQNSILRLSSKTMLPMTPTKRRMINKQKSKLGFSDELNTSAVSTVKKDYGNNYNTGTTNFDTLISSGNTETSQTNGLKKYTQNILNRSPNNLKMNPIFKKQITSSLFINNNTLKESNNNVSIISNALGIRNFNKRKGSQKSYISMKSFKSMRSIKIVEEVPQKEQIKLALPSMDKKNNDLEALYDRINNKDYRRASEEISKYFKEHTLRDPHSYEENE